MNCSPALEAILSRPPWLAAHHSSRTGQTESNCSHVPFQGEVGSKRRASCQTGPSESQPALAAAEASQVLEALALLAGAAEVEFLDVLVVAQRLRGSVEHDLALLHDVAVTGDRQRRAGILLDQQHRDAEIAAHAPHDGK